MIKSNCHTHTVYCDGKNSPEEMIERAVSLGFTSIGLSAHSPMYYKNDYALTDKNIGEYFNEIERLKEKYKGSIEIYNGVEKDADSTDISKYHFDYVIASVHQIHKGDKIYSIDYTADDLARCVKEEFSGDFYQMAQHYYDDLCNFIAKEKPDVIGHFDLIEKFNDSGKQFDNSTAAYEDIVKGAINKIADTSPESIFEVNTGAMYRCKNKNPYPSPYIMTLLKENGFKITITSDSHNIESLDFAFDEMVQYCKKYGFEEVYILSDGSFRSVKI